MGESITIMAFDQHAASVVAAVLLPGHQTPATHQLSSDVAAIGRFVKRVRRQGPVRCCYEAGPCGFALQRSLRAQAVPCEVIAPTLIPRRPGDRIKTDRRDAKQLAVLYRAGALTPIHIPTEAEEAARDLLVPLRDRCSFGRFPWLISQALSATYVAGELRLYLERNCRLPESPSRRASRGACQFQGAEP